jgi:hypothetical protein
VASKPRGEVYSVLEIKTKAVKEQVTMKKCPFCAEEIQDDAVKCKHCGEWLDKDSFSQAVEVNPSETQPQLEGVSAELDEEIKKKKEAGLKQCPTCGKWDVYRAVIEDGGQGDWCPNCKKSITMVKSVSPKIEKAISPGFSITAIVLVIASLVTPQFIAPIFLIVAIITGFIGFSRKEWGGAPPLIAAILSIFLFVGVIYNLYTIQQKVSESLGKITKMDNPFGENDSSYTLYLDITDVKAERSYGHLTVKGSVKNNGSKKVTQVVIKVKIMDKNNDVVNTTKAHVFGEIEPSESKTFQSMTPWHRSAKTYSLSIEEVRVKQ